MRENAHRYKIRIDNPCNQNWNGFPPKEGGGRYCGNCAKNITDFSQYSDDELINAIKNDMISCGRFEIKQLDRIIKQEEVAKMLGLKASVLRIITGWVLLFFSKQGVTAEVSQSLYTEINTSYKKGDVKTKELATIAKQDTLKNYITGRILEKETAKPVAYAVVLVQGTQISTLSDTAGNFILTLPADMLGQTITIEIVSVGYDKMAVLVDPKQTRNNLIQLEMASALMGEVVITNCFPKKKKWWQVWKRKKSR